MSKKPSCLGCPPCCPVGCTWDNSNTSKVEISEVIIPSEEYNCIFGGDIVRTEDGKVGINRKGDKFHGFAALTTSGEKYLAENQPEFYKSLGI